MSGINSTNNNRMGLTAQSTLTGNQENLTSTNGVLNISSSGSGSTQYQELATTTPATGTLSLGRYQTALPTLTNGQMNEPMLDSTSTLLVNSSTLAKETGGNLATIATNTGNSATSANQTNGNQLTKITDGTNTVAVDSSGGLIVKTEPAIINVGQKAVNTTAVQISSTSTVPTNGILIGALSTNSASIFIGGSGVTISSGAELQPGASLPFTANLNTLYIISVASTTDSVWYNVT